MRNSILFTFLILGIYTHSIGQLVTTIYDYPNQKIDDALLLDNQGNLYGSHYMGENVYKVTPGGQVSVAIPGLNTPNGLAFDSKGNIFVCDNIGNRIYKVSNSGLFLDTLSIVSPSGIIKMQDSDTMLFTTYAGHTLTKLAPDGSTTMVHSGYPLNGPVGLVYDDNGRLFVGNFTDRKIFQVKEDTLVYVAQIPGGSSLGFITYAKGAIYGTTFNQHKIYKVIPTTIDSVILFSGLTKGSVDGSIGQALFDQPNGITATSFGDTIYISDFGTGKVRMITGVTLDNLFIPESESTLLVYPNPTRNKARLTFEEEIPKASVQLVNMMGKKMNVPILKIGTGFDFELESLPTGNYFIVLTINNKMESIQLIKE